MSSGPFVGSFTADLGRSTLGLFINLSSTSLKLTVFLSGPLRLTGRGGIAALLRTEGFLKNWESVLKTLWAKGED